MHDGGQSQKHPHAKRKRSHLSMGSFPVGHSLPLRIP